jgi:hypothetical protein
MDVATSSRFPVKKEELIIAMASAHKKNGVVFIYDYLLWETVQTSWGDDDEGCRCRCVVVASPIGCTSV